MRPTFPGAASELRARASLFLSRLALPPCIASLLESELQTPSSKHHRVFFPLFCSAILNQPCLLLLSVFPLRCRPICVAFYLYGGSELLPQDCCGQHLPPGRGAGCWERHWQLPPQFVTRELYWSASGPNSALLSLCQFTPEWELPVPFPATAEPHTGGGAAQCLWGNSPLPQTESCLS